MGSKTFIKPPEGPLALSGFGAVLHEASRPVAADVLFRGELGQTKLVLYNLLF